MKIDCHYHLSKGEGHQERNRKSLENARSVGIDKVCVSILGATTPDEFQESNRILYECMKEHPDMVLGYSFVNPCYLREAVEELERCVRDYAFVGLKLLAHCRCSEPMVFPLAEKAIELDVPILIHCGHCAPELKGSQANTLTDPEDVASLAKRYPEAKLLQAHIGGGGDWEWGIKAIRDCKNVWLDTSGSGTESGMIEMAVSELGVERVVFGTDNALYAGVGKVQGADIPEEEKEIIFGNMQNLLK
jgi:predicted TIM-barrel fold metal-dependent hydrolase